MSRSKIGVWHLLILACIATNAHAAPECKDDSWGVLSSKGYNVCKTAEYLLQPGHCPGISNENRIPPISTMNPWYKAWGFSGVSKCTCTSVVFRLLTACAGCQKWSLNEAMNQNWPNLTSYEGNSCTNFQSDSQLGGLQPQPNDSDSEWTTLAPWAAQMSSVEFSLREAVAKANSSSGPFSTATIPPSSTTSEPAPASTEPPVANAASGKSSPNIGAIVGGVVGGVTLIGAIIGFLLFLHRRKRRTRDVAPSSEFLKPEYYASPPLLPVQDRRDSEYRDDIEEEATPQMAPRTLSWVGGIVTTRRQEDNEDEVLPPFTQGTYIGPSPHEKDHPERRHTDESDATATSNTHLLSSSSRPGTSE